MGMEAPGGRVIASDGTGATDCGTPWKETVAPDGLFNTADAEGTVALEAATNKLDAPAHNAMPIIGETFTTSLSSPL